MVHIIFWNPDISSMDRGRMSEEMPEIIAFGGHFNWSFWEHDQVHPGDICYLIRCNDSSGRHGVVLRGKIISEPYVAADWSGQNRRIFYADWFPQEFIDSEVASPLPPDQLEADMPDFRWRGGHSGVPLPAEYEQILENLWYVHIEKLIPELNDSLFVNKRANELTDSALDFWKTINKHQNC